MARLEWPLIIQEKERFDWTDLFLFHPSLFLRTPSMAKCGNWGSTVICQVGPEAPAILLWVCEGCLFPRYWSCQGQDSMKEPLGLVTFGYVLDPGSDGRFWCQEPLCDNRTVLSNFSGLGERKWREWAVMGEKENLRGRHSGTTGLIFPG